MGLFLYLKVTKSSQHETPTFDDQLFSWFAFLCSWRSWLLLPGLVFYSKIRRAYAHTAKHYHPQGHDGFYGHSWRSLVRGNTACF